MTYTSDRLHPNRAQYPDLPSLTEHLTNALPLRPSKSLEHTGNGPYSQTNGATQARQRVTHHRRGGLLGHILKLPNLLILLWLYTIWWGERLAFSSSVEKCRWEHWERWPSHALPHRMVLIADPQLVDPHTYPGRPWPLSKFTIFYTDLYLRRSFLYLQETLRPDTLLFLGDLFDGGREWGTLHTASPEVRYKKYGADYWMNEYNRFGSLFFSNWHIGSHTSSSEPRGRRIISSLPGNHDLGFASGIESHVRNRFDAYFGPLNRIDVLGNHTFISIDTVSLSAMDRADPATGSSGIGDGTATSVANGAIWSPVKEFLDDAQGLRRRAVQRELRYLTGQSEQFYFEGDLAGFAPVVNTLAEIPIMNSSQEPASGIAISSFPTVLLTHVPLYRPPDTSCGPLRESQHAISVSGGYQYQNVLTPLVSKEIITKVDAQEVAQVYSGDDHDYCEIEHSEFTGRVREVTVKSMSWAMGVRRPGFLVVSLWNPVDVRVEDDKGEFVRIIPKDTIQDHLCLLPDQLAIFIRYAHLLGISILILALQAFATVFGQRQSGSMENSAQLLPVSEGRATATQERRRSPQPFTHSRSHATSISSISSSNPSENTFSNNISVRTPRSASPSSAAAAAANKLAGYGNLPPSSRSASPSKFDANFAPARRSHVVNVVADGGTDSHDDWGMPSSSTSLKGRRVSRRRLALVQLGWNLWRVAWVVGIFYVWVIWRG